MSKKIILEVLIATPPTSKCEETVDNLKEIVRRYPDIVSLVIFKRGIDFMPDELRMNEFMTEEDYRPKEDPSLQMRQLITKGRAVPTVIVDGVFFSAFDVPKFDEVEAQVQKILLSTSEK